MKKDWEIKRLGEVSIITMGQSPDSSSYNTNGQGIPFFQGCANFGQLYPNVITYCSSPTKLANAYDILLSVRAPIGTLNIANKTCCIGRGLASIKEIPGKSKYKYLFYYLKHIANDLKDKGTGATFKAINKDILHNCKIHIPSIVIQEKIVKELDIIISIINNKKKQLEELDKLAQAIFYDMFGDPIINEKGWEVKKLSDVCSNLFAGGDVPKDDFSETKTKQHNVPIISNGVGNKALYGYTSKPRVKEISLTISGRGTIGYCEVRTVPFLPVVRLIVATPNTNIILPITLKFIVDAFKFKGSGGAIPQLTIPMIKDKEIILPYISLQQQFSEKIEAIEKQKTLIKKSLEEVETLFNSRMDYYFN